MAQPGTGTERRRGGGGSHGEFGGAILPQQAEGASRGADDRGAAPTFGRDLPARTGVLYRRARAVYPGAESVASRNHSPSHTQDCQLLGSRAQGTSREGGAGEDDRSGQPPVPPGI